MVAGGRYRGKVSGGSDGDERYLADLYVDGNDHKIGDDDTGDRVR